jgi:hypothetical protein
MARSYAGAICDSSRRSDRDRRRCEDRLAQLNSNEGDDVSAEMKPRLVRRGGVAVACLAVGFAGVAWGGCGNSETTKSVEQHLENGLNEVEKGVEKGVEEAKKGLKNNSEARKSLEKAKEAAQEGIEKGKEEAKKGLEEAEKYKSEYKP